MLHAKEKELLDYLAEKSGYSSLSDMKFDRRWEGEIRKIPDNAFPLCEWQKAIDYLMGNKEKFESVREIKKHLSKLL